MEYQSTAFVLPLYCLQPDMYEKKIHYIDSTSVHIIWLNARFYLSNKRSKCFSSHKMYLWWWCTINTLYLCMILNSLSYFQEVLPQLSLTSECLTSECLTSECLTCRLPQNVCLPQNVFQTLALLNPIIVTFLKTSPYSLPGAGSKCISDSINLSLGNTGCDVMSKTRLLSFFIRSCMFKSLDLRRVFNKK